MRWIPQEELPYAINCMKRAAIAALKSPFPTARYGAYIDNNGTKVSWGAPFKTVDELHINNIHINEPTIDAELMKTFMKEVHDPLTNAPVLANKYSLEDRAYLLAIRRANPQLLLRSMMFLIHIAEDGMPIYEEEPLAPRKLYAIAKAGIKEVVLAHKVAEHRGIYSYSVLAYHDMVEREKLEEQLEREAREILREQEQLKRERDAHNAQIERDRQAQEMQLLAQERDQFFAQLNTPLPENLQIKW